MIYEKNLSGYSLSWNRWDGKSDGSTDVSPTPTLEWSSVDAEVDGTKYQIPGELDPGRKYIWQVRGVVDDAAGEWSSKAEFTTEIENDEFEDETELCQNYPNPFNPTTQIRFTIAETQQITLKVYDMSGKLVTNLMDGELTQTGSHEVTFNANNLASGIYFYRLATESEIVTRKMTLMK